MDEENMASEEPKTQVQLEDFYAFWERKFKHSQDHLASLGQQWLPLLPSARPSQWPRIYKAVVLAIGLFTIFAFYSCFIAVPTPIAGLPIDRTPYHSRTYPTKLVRFWQAFSQQLENARPDCSTIEVNGQHDQTKMKFEPMYHQKPRVDQINITMITLFKMREAHHSMVDISRQMAPKLPYIRGTRGIVTIGGGKYNSPLLISLRMLRRSGSRLPVEVFLLSWDEYDSHICEHLLPSLDAKCRILSDIFALAPTHSDTHRYQYKVFAILFSSFEDVFFLDADNFPAFNPDSVLKTEPFVSYGLVTWPDMWAQTSSKYFFEIAEIPTPDITRLSSESGQILFSKRKHGATLLLASYYNYHGPNYYWPLLSQNAWGQGDKETFLHAALALDIPFWDVKTPVWNLGQWVADDNFRHVGMGQHHPEDDFTLSYGDIRNGKTIRPFMLHINFPWKLDPELIIGDEGPTFHPNKTQIRLLGTKEDMIKSFGYDAEARLWEEILLRACEIDAACDKVKAYYENIILRP
jgi:alpha 1,2-mannosyltransferase